MPDVNIEDAVTQIGTDIFGASEETTDDVTEIVTEEVEASPNNDTPIEQPTTRPPPKSWAKDYHEHWGKLDPKAQEYIERREKEMLDGLGQYKTYSDLGKSIDRVVEPYKQYLEQNKVDAPQAISYLLAAHTRLTTGPVEQRLLAYQELGRSLGFNDTKMDPSVQAALQAAQEAKSLVNQFQQSQLNEARERTEKEVNEFAKDKPYFDDVADDIVTFINAGLSLQDAYDRAIWANPVTRAKEQERLKQEAATALKDKARQAGAAAKKASAVNVRSRDTGRTPTEPLGKMDDTLAKTLAEIRERAH